MSVVQGFASVADQDKISNALRAWQKLTSFDKVLILGTVVYLFVVWALPENKALEGVPWQIQAPLWVWPVLFGLRVIAAAFEGVAVWWEKKAKVAADAEGQPEIDAGAPTEGKE